MKPVGVPKTVGKLRSLIEKLPDAMPLHHRGTMGDHPVGWMLVIRTLAPALSEPAYFADIETDTVWSKPEQRASFGEAIEALCSVVNADWSRDVDILILQNGGFRQDYVGIYIDGKMWWQNNDYDETYPARLLELLQMPGEKHVTVETVDEEVAHWMGLSKTYPDTLDEWRQIVTVVTQDH